MKEQENKEKDQLLCIGCDNLVDELENWGINGKYMLCEECCLTGRCNQTC